VWSLRLPERAIVPAAFFSEGSLKAASDQAIFLSDLLIHCGVGTRQERTVLPDLPWDFCGFARFWRENF